MMTSLRPDRVYLDRGDEHWRGGQVWALNGATTTIRVLRVGSQLVSNQVIDTALIPVDALSIGCPVCCRTVDDVIVEVIGSTFCWGDAPRGDNAASVARGVFSPGIVGREIHGEPLTFWEA